MLLGNPNRFGIEILLDDQFDGAWMNGRTCYWIAGQQVGNFDIGDSLRDVLFRWERMSCDKNRDNEYLFTLETQELVTLLYCGLYYVECREGEAIKQLSIEQQWARHNINPETESFQSWVIFLVGSGPLARCLYAPCTSGLKKSFEMKIELQEFDDVLQQAIGYLSAIYSEYIDEEITSDKKM